LKFQSCSWLTRLRPSFTTKFATCSSMSTDFGSRSSISKRCIRARRSNIRRTRRSSRKYTRTSIALGKRARRCQRPKSSKLIATSIMDSRHLSSSKSACIFSIRSLNWLSSLTRTIRRTTVNSNNRINPGSPHHTGSLTIP